jgi:dipeptidyl aminopeptidase/acylaminoacyl peptidase
VVQSWGYRWNAQVFSARGYVTLMINRRGSTGYGQKFTDEITNDWGGKAYTDVMKGIFPDEGHWILKPQNAQHWYKTFLDWLATYLK